MAITLNHNDCAYPKDDTYYGSVFINLDEYEQSQYSVPESATTPNQDESDGSEEVVFVSAKSLVVNQPFVIDIQSTRPSPDVCNSVFSVTKKYEKDVSTDKTQKFLVAESLDQSLLLFISEQNRSTKWLIVSQEHPQYTDVRELFYEKYSDRLPTLVAKYPLREFGAEFVTEDMYSGTECKSYLIQDEWFYENVENIEPLLISENV